MLILDGVKINGNNNKLVKATDNMRLGSNEPPHKIEKTVLHNDKKTVSHNDKKTVVHNTKKTVLDNGKKTVLHNERTILDKFTHEEEKVALILGITAVFTIIWFVIK